MGNGRSRLKIMTRDAQILRHMRISKQLSLKKAGRLVSISGSAISHIETGRMDLSRARIETLVEAYGYTKSDYLEFHDGKPIPINLRDECILLLRTCDERKFEMLHPVIVNLAK